VALSPKRSEDKEVIIIFQLIGTVAAITAIITYAGMKFVEWWECGK
jgi:hypothetical protein